MSRDTKKEVDIYDLDYRISYAHSQLKRAVSETNYELIKRYDDYMISASLSKVTREIHLKKLYNLTRFLDRDWKDATKEDTDNLVAKVMTKYADVKGKETNSTHDHKKVLKIFFRWLKLGSRDFKEVGDPPETKNIRIKKVESKVSREDLITDDDVLKLLEICNKHSTYPSRDRAFIDCQSEAGTRPGEMLSLRRKNVMFDKHGAKIYVDGKTGTRTVRLVRSAPTLAQWMSDHPFRDNPEAPLWCDRHGKAMTYRTARDLVTRRAKQARLPKRVFMNLFRHSEATETANYMTEAQMRIRHGWSKESKMPARYVHLVNADVDKAILERYGIRNKEENQEEIEQKLPKVCARCAFSNPWDSKTCSKCGLSLDVKSAMELEDETRSEMDSLKEQNSRLEAKVDRITEAFMTFANLVADQVSTKDQLLLAIKTLELVPDEKFEKLTNVKNKR